MDSKELLERAGKKPSDQRDRRARLVEAVSYAAAVSDLAGAGHVDADDLTALREDAEAELKAAMRSCIEGAKSGAEIRRDRREGKQALV